jgi:hypothetical protein
MVGIASVLGNGVFWAGALGAVWFPLVMVHEERPGASRSRLGICTIAGALVVGVLLHGVLKSETLVTLGAAPLWWAGGFCAYSAALFGLTLRSPTYLPDGRVAPIGDHLKQKVGVPLLACVFIGIPLALVYGKVVRAIPPGEIAKLSEPTPAAPKAAGPPGDASYSDTWVIDSAEKSVREKLADPRSAKFRKVFIRAQPSGTKAVCGEVNAKNHLGGYDGYQGFISAGVEKYTWLASEMTDFQESWQQLCGNPVAIPIAKKTSPPPALIPIGLSIPVPSDSAATYRLHSLRREGRSFVTIVTHRNGPSGESFSRRRVNCTNMTSRYTGDGATLAEMEASASDLAMATWEAGAISKDIAKFACKRG